MAVTTFDLRTALIVVDLQKGLLGSPFIHSVDKVVERSRALLDAFRARGLPRLGETGTAQDIIDLLEAKRV